MGIIISTEKGKIEGYASDGLYRFEGIPYAAPPVGPLRLKPPVEHAAWDGIWDCTKYGNAAPQLAKQPVKVLQDSEKISEDCLYLNVYTNDISAKNRPVVVYFHGGAFQKGSATFGYTPNNFTDEGFVAVSFNFRLGVLGFLDFSSYLGEEYIQSGKSIA